MKERANTKFEVELMAMKESIDLELLSKMSNGEVSILNNY